jgi:F0F1-type ATP synthase membrane subunit b/b'
MARNRDEKLKSAAVKIGTALGRADRSARGIAKNVRVSANELSEDLLELTKAADRLAQDLRKASKRLREVLR